MDAVEWGLDNEDSARVVYVDYMKNKHSSFQCDPSGFFIHSCNKFIGATADGVTKCNCCDHGTLEIKCPFKHRDISVQEATRIDNEFCMNTEMKLKQTHRYYTQVQFQMYVFNCNFCGYDKPNVVKSVVIVRILRDGEFCSRLLDKCSSFTYNYILPEILTKRLLDKQSEIVRVSDELQKWCLCNEPEYGKMVNCGSEQCSIGWFYYRCVNMRRKPRGRWLCPKCIK